jgi:predicted PilT family ATPase
MLNLSAHEIDALSARGEFGSNRRDWKYFDEKLSALRVNEVRNIIERGRLLIEAKDELEHGSFEAMVKRHFDLSTARMYRIVAAHPVISDRCHVNALPPSMRTSSCSNYSINKKVRAARDGLRGLHPLQAARRHAHGDRAGEHDEQPETKP